MLISSTNTFKSFTIICSKTDNRVANESEFRDVGDHLIEN